MSHRIYLASSWRNERQPAVLTALRSWGHEVYDFRNPTEGNQGFSWKQVSLQANPGPAELVTALDHPVAREGFGLDSGAMRWCTACVLLLPCGRSAHLELGWCAGAGKLCLVLAESLPEPELMYLLCNPHKPAAKTIATSLGELFSLLHPAA